MGTVCNGHGSPTRSPQLPSGDAREPAASASRARSGRDRHGARGGRDQPRRARITRVLRLARPRRAGGRSPPASSPKPTARPVGYAHLAPSDTEADPHLVAAIVVDPDHRDGVVDARPAGCRRRRGAGAGRTGRALGQRRDRRARRGRHRGRAATVQRAAPDARPPAAPGVGEVAAGRHGPRLRPRPGRRRLAASQQPRLLRAPGPGRVDPQDARTPDRGVLVRSGRLPARVRPRRPRRLLLDEGAPAGAGRHRARSARSTSSASTPTARAPASAGR